MFPDWLLFILIFLFVDILILGYVFYRRRMMKSRDVVFFRKQWQGIMAHKNLVQAILDADKLLGIALTKKGYHGTVGEQLKKARPIFTNNNDVWFSHKLRNRVAHELNIKIDPAEGDKALRFFKQALKDLNVL